MKTLAPLLLALLASHAVAAPATGAPGSAACTKALEALRELEDRVLAAPRERAEGLRRQVPPARRTAALACLGEKGSEGEEPAARAPRVEAPPRTVLPPTLPAMRPPVVPAPSRVPPPALPRTLGACDANGCWTSDGVRLQRVGPQLLGPRGFCSTAGNAVQCP